MSFVLVRQWTMTELRVEGLSVAELLDLPSQEFDALIMTEEPVAFRAGSAVVLGKFGRVDDRLTLELGHIDGGGEGVLPMIATLAQAYSHRHDLSHIEWIVHAVNCQAPNSKLRRILERRGFAIRELPDVGEIYYLLVQQGCAADAASPRHWRPKL